MPSDKIDSDELLRNVDHTTTLFLEMVSSFGEQRINEIPFKGSWTAAQVAEHVTRSNNGIIKELHKRGTIPDREPDAGVEGLRKTFLDFSTKLQSPKFILPTRDIYEKQALLSNLEKSIKELLEIARGQDPYEEIDHAIFGKVTKLELLHFVVYHTQRHIHQMKGISNSLEEKTKGSRRLIAFMHVSLDGFVAGTNGEMNWIIMDDEIFENAIELANTTDTALYGRTTYQMMESYWPSVLTNEASTELELRHANWVENINKIVFSGTLEEASWNNTRLIKENIPAEIERLKEQPGEKMMIFGSPRLTHSFMQWNLIDEYRLNINPVILGSGIPLFKDVNARADLKLLHTTIFKSGVVGLHYETRNNHSRK